MRCDPMLIPQQEKRDEEENNRVGWLAVNEFQSSLGWSCLFERGFITVQRKNASHLKTRKILQRENSPVAACNKRRTQMYI